MPFLDLNGLSYFKDKIMTLLNQKVNTSAINANNGVAGLDSSGKVPVDRLYTNIANGVAKLDSNGTIPSVLLPGSVDSIIECTGPYPTGFPGTGESSKIYVDLTTNITYRWSGTGYVATSSSLALGTTSSSAYYGDKGDIAYQHAQASGSAFNEGLYKIGTNAEGHVTSATAITKSDITALGIPGQDTNTTYEVKAAANGGTGESLCTTGEKYTWNNKASTAVATTSANGLMTKEMVTNLNAAYSAISTIPAVDRSISDGSTSTKVPTSAAVASFVEGKGYTTNTGTITGITMNGASKGTSGVVNLGTVLTAHQTITKAMVTNALGYTPYNSTNPNGYTANAGTITGITMNGTSRGTSGVVNLGTVVTDVSGKKNTQSAVSDPTASGVSLTFIKTISQNTQGVITATKATVQSASPSVAGIVTTGNQTFKGEKTFRDNIAIENTASRYKRIFSRNEAGNTFSYMTFDGGDDGSSKIVNPRIGFTEYSPKATPDTGNSGYYESYWLPSPNAARTANVSYDILTTKKLITVAQGGTGASTAAAARTNLGVPADSAVVHLANTETITGTKTFSSAVTFSNAIWINGGVTIGSGAGLVCQSSQSIGGYVNITNSGNISDANPSLKTLGGAYITKQLHVHSAVAGANGGTGAITVTGGIYTGKSIYCNADIYCTKLHGTLANDYAECRQANVIDGGYCVTETSSGMMTKTWARLQPGCRLTSDTYGTLIGESDEAKTPIAVSGRVLAYPYRDISEYHLGDAVCSAPDGKIDVMTREEIREYPERIIGTVSEIPTYDVWYGGNQNDPEKIPVNGRIWIYVR